MPPTGRAAKPTQKVAKADNWAASGESFGEKNSGPKTKAAAVAYRKKSYHSIDVPIQLAIATRTIGELPLDSWVLFMVTSYHDSCFNFAKCALLQDSHTLSAFRVDRMDTKRDHKPVTFYFLTFLFILEPQSGAL